MLSHFLWSRTYCAGVEMDLGLSPRFTSSTGIPHLRFASISTDRRFPVGFTADSGSVAARRRPARCGSSRPPWLDGSISACVLDQGPMWIPEELAGAQTRAWLLVRPPQRARPALASRPLANPVGGGWGRGVRPGVTKRQLPPLGPCVEAQVCRTSLSGDLADCQTTARS
jgi:hypothetical protein